VIVIDTSALMAILLREPEAAQIAKTIEESSVCLLSSANCLEAGIVIESRKGAMGAVEFDALIDGSGIEIRPVTLQLARAARLGYRLYGKGRHRAALNYGDCFSYALAKLAGAPLLAKGGEFGLTDIALVQY